MTPTVFLYVVLFSALVAGAAAAVEWGAQGRLPARYFWSAAIVLALAAPPIAMAVHASRTAADGAKPDVELLMVSIATGSQRTQTHVRWANTHQTPISALAHRAKAFGDRMMPVVSARALVTMLVGWIIASLALIAWIVAGMLHWRRERREWEPATVDGVAVEVSPSTGPAVLGVLSQKIVLPSWATAMAPEYRTLMLAHECEHIRARDPQRLALALGALVLMPWNLALWWCAARLRRAIELDCDARVLRTHPATKAYGYLLLEVASRGRNSGALAIPLVGLLRLPSELETRLRAMTRPRSIARRTVLCASALVLGAVGAAFATPVPRAAAFGGANRPAAPFITERSGEQRTTVLVGDARLTLDAAAFSPGSHAIAGRMVRLTIDTVPEHDRDSIAKLNRRLDSVTTRLRQLEQRQRALPPDVIAFDTTNARPMRGKVFRVTLDSARVHAAGRDRYSITIENGRDTASGPMMIRGPLRVQDTGEQRRSAARIDSAMAKKYPELVAHPDPRIAVWFVSDSSGHVLRTARSELDATGAFPPGFVSKQFPDIKADDIGSIEVRKHSPTAGAGAVIWIALKQ